MDQDLQSEAPRGRVLVQMEKIAVAPSPVYPTASWDEWTPGLYHDGKSLPLSYQISGYLVAPVRLGLPVMIERTERNGVDVAGIFVSTPVVAFADEGLIETYNSVYRLSYVNDLRRYVE